MVLFFSSAGDVVSTAGIFTSLICPPPSSAAHDPAVVIYMGKDKHESEFRISVLDTIYNRATIQFR